MAKSRLGTEDELFRLRQTLSLRQYDLLVSATLLAILLVACGRTPPQAIQSITINNVEPRRDVHGEVIDAHDGCLQFFNGRFYLYGTAYGKSPGYDRPTNRYRVYSSPDLGQWTFERELFNEAPTGVYYRPYVVFNEKTRKYVLWYNWYSKLWNGQAGVATSDSPMGPFSIISTNVQLHSTDPGDGSLFVDDDGTAYYIYTALSEGGTVRVERLTSDYLAATGKTSGILAMGTESPLLFRRNNLYYALCGPRCLACPEGSEVQVLTATAPLGPYTAKAEADINRRPVEIGTDNTKTELWAALVSSVDATNVTEKLADSSTKIVPMIVHSKNRPLIAGQETWVAKIPTAGEPLFIWMADRWESTPDGIEGHNFQFWSAPLKFRPAGDILPLENVAAWQIQWKR